MQKVSVIYRAPKGDSKVLEWNGHTFFDGVATEIECNDNNAHMITKMSKHPHFELSEMGTVNKHSHKPEPAPAPVEDPEDDDDPPVAKKHDPKHAGRAPVKHGRARGR